MFRRARLRLLPRRLVPLGLLLLAAVWPGGALAAQTRHARRLGAEHGLVPAYVGSLAQGADGLIWIGTAAGLYRYDGIEMRRWAPGTLRSLVSAVAVSPWGTLVALDEAHGSVFDVVEEGARPVAGPDGAPLRGIHHLAVDRSGTLWALRRDGVLARDAAGRWTALSRDRLDGSPLHRVVAGDSGALILTAAAVWRAFPGAPPRLLARAVQPRHALELTGGRLLVVTFAGTVREFSGGGEKVLLDLRGRGIEIVERHGTLWASADHYLVSLPPGGTPEVLGPDDGLAGGGPLLVDQEGSLWLGTGAGLLHFAEPDTRIWVERHGLPTAHTRYLAKTGDTIWVNTWRGSGVLMTGDGRWHAGPVAEWTSAHRLFVDRSGVLWSGSWDRNPGIVEVREGKVHRRLRSPVRLLGFAERGDGSLWFATQAGLLVARNRDAPIERFRGLPFGSDTVPVDAVLHDAARRTWVASARRVCSASGVAVTAAPPESWTCGEIPAGHHVTSLLEPPGGALLAAVVRGGVWRHREGTWEELPVRGGLPGIDVAGLVPSRTGGVWVLGQGIAHRIVRRPGSDEWTIAEELTAWHGLREASPVDLVEEPDGTLWLTSTGVVRIPAAARYRRDPPRRVNLVDAWVDDERVPLGGDLVLPHRRNRLALRFAAASYRDPSLLRYEVRASPDEHWRPVRGPPVFRWVDLRPGRYQAEVRASLDGVTWTAASARFAFRVLPPWYVSPWALGGFALLGLVCVAVVYRARVAFLVGLERQRTRIAMDLHDELGSGLGSIGILSGVLSSDRLPPAQGEELAHEIARTAGELGTALSDIVWSLDARESTLEELAGRLAEHGRRLFANGTDLATEFPEAWPRTPLSLAVRRNVMLIALEALHNAARHSGARRVIVRIAVRGAGAEVAVEDDGRGIAPPGSAEGNGTGNGLSNIRRRAAEIGARLRWEKPESGGTRMTLAFRLRAGSRRRRWRVARSVRSRSRDALT